MAVAVGSLAPFIRPYVEAVLSHRQSDIALCEAQTGRHGSSLCDRFLARIPFCGSVVPFVIVFNESLQDQPPDVIFEKEKESGVEFSLSEVHSLAYWDAADSRSLLKLLLELRYLYQQKQRERISSLSIPSIRFDLETIQSIEGIEMELDQASKKLRMLVPLEMSKDLAAVVLDTLEAGNLLHQLFRLDVSWTLTSSLEASAQGLTPTFSVLPPRSPKWLADIGKDLRLPRWQSGSTLMSFLLGAAEQLNHEVSAVLRKRMDRKGFFTCLAEQFGSPCEFDAHEYTRICFLCEAGKGKEGLLLRFVLSPQFPQQCPRVEIQSVEFVQEGRPFLLVLTAYEYDANASHREMAAALRRLVVQKAPAFLHTVRPRSSRPSANSTDASPSD